MFRAVSGAEFFTAIGSSEGVDRQQMGWALSVGAEPTNLLSARRTGSLTDNHLPVRIRPRLGHAIRFIAQPTQEAFLFPARHQAGQANPSCPPMGARFRLNAAFSLPASTCSALCQTVLTTMETHGLILADNGSNRFFLGTADPGWASAEVDQLKSIPASAFVAVDESCLMVSPDSGRALQPGTPAFNQSCH